MTTRSTATRRPTRATRCRRSSATPTGRARRRPRRSTSRPGELVGSVSGELGLREFLEARGHRLVVTSDKDGPDSVFERELPEAEVVISQPFWPAYLTAERIAKAPKLKLALTAGIGSDHVDLQAAIERGLTVAEVTYSNSISVAEHVVMMILGLVRNYIPSYQRVVDGGWNIADCASRSYDLEGMQVGTRRRRADRLGGAAAAEAVRGRPALHRPPPPAGRGRGGAGRRPSTPTSESMVEVCDVVTINAPLHPETENLFDAELLAKMKRGAYLINTARGKICDRDAVARRLRERPAGRLRRRRLVPAAGAAGPPLALDAPPRHDPAHLRHQPLGPGPLRGRHARDPRVLVRRAPDPRGVPDRRRRHASPAPARTPTARATRRAARRRPPASSAADADGGGPGMKMRAAVLEEFGQPLAVQEVELAEPRAGEVLVRLVACGVCHTDLYTASGADPSGYAPTVLGHEGAGVVERVGADVTSLAPGDHVVTLFSPQCGECVHCVDPRTNLCMAIREQQNKGFLPDGTTRISRARARDPPLHGLLDLRRVHGDAGDRPGQDQPRGALRARLPLRLRPLDRPRRGDQHRRGRAGQHLRRLRRRDGRAGGGRRLPAAGRRADRLRRPLRRAARAGPRPGRDRPARRWRGRRRGRSSR